MLWKEKIKLNIFLHFIIEGYIPRFLLLTTEIRSQQSPEDKAAHIYEIGK